MLSFEFFGLQNEPLSIHLGLCGIERREFAFGGTAFGEFGELEGQFTLLLAQDTLLLEGDELHRVLAGLGDKATLRITHLQLRGGDELAGELFFEREPLGDGKRLIDAKEHRAWTGAAFVLKTGLERGIREPATAELASASFLDGHAGGFEHGMMAANTSGDVLEAKLGSAGGENEDKKDKERTEHEEAGLNGLKSGMGEPCEHSGGHRRGWRRSILSQILSEIVCESREGQGGPARLFTRGG